MSDTAPDTLPAALAEKITHCGAQAFTADCPSRRLLDEIADKWSMMILTVLTHGPARFNAIKRALEGISQKSLTQCLRRLERNGLVTREVLPCSPVAVQYGLTPLGETLLPPFRALYAWTYRHMEEVDAARAAFDADSTG
ncbi:helix-turn-helix transcriptional regulator [Pseudooceanicola sp. CBS1P-1]|uniref:Transcriptional regulator n=1 Tax=Pseudooceanicola albus TaxID=2692189 RepID=A0A6L7FY98_9RHOB|nr:MULTISPECIES: helix-turn-helix domain-containing protein [Pseudooceanicola]MBT9383928.1 helix-turn-helix transcriptional regulator [Pseudooceanicola endophyticus]MXN16659.1 transcriptional regulator [Pseudooceanicola albus]